MSLAIAGKILGGVLVTAGSCVGAYFIYDALKNDDVSFLASSKDITQSDAVWIKDRVKNYKCKSNEKEFDCTIYKFVINTTSKHSNIREFNQIKTDLTDKTDLKTKDNLYKVTVYKNEKGDKIDLSTKTIDVIAKEGGTDTSKKFAELDVKFVMDGSTISDKNKTKYFVFQGQESKKIDDASAYKCLTTGTDAITESNCKIYDFSNETEVSGKTGREKWIFNKGTTDTNSITNNKYYLIELESVSEKTNKIRTINIKKAADSNVSEHNYDVNAATMIGESGSEKLFIWDY